MVVAVTAITLLRLFLQKKHLMQQAILLVTQSNSKQLIFGNPKDYYTTAQPDFGTPMQI
jgi:hypothetical protein